MADTLAFGRTQPLAARRTALRRARRGTGGVVFGGVGEDFELLADIELSHMFFICSSVLGCQIGMD